MPRIWQRFIYRTQEWENCGYLSQNEQPSFWDNKERIPKQNTNTQGAGIISMFRRIENQNKEQNNELQGQTNSEEYSIIVTD